ncbi:hypothetical protein SH501x_000503 [Pirellulaceae bacterium SH501]
MWRRKAVEVVSRIFTGVLAHVPFTGVLAHVPFTGVLAHVPFTEVAGAWRLMGLAARLRGKSIAMPAWFGCFALMATCSAQDAMHRLTLESLNKTRAIIETFESQRVHVSPSGALKTVRANLHVHSELSHDSRGKIDSIVAAAKRAKTDVLLFTEHPSQEKDFFLDGNRGIIDGVLCIPGAEMKGMLVYPTLSLAPFSAAEPGELASIVRSRGGHIFLSHLEERMDWQLPGITGTEIYNTHADFKKQAGLVKAMKNPLWFVQIASLLKQYPQEIFSALQSYPEDYLKRFDELCQIHPHTGVAANDAHENVGIQLKVGSDPKTVVVADALGEELVKLPRLAIEGLIPVPADAAEGTVILRVQLDPYENSLRHAGTYLLVSDLTQAAVWEALDKGRTFVAFDWIANARGFEWEATQESGGADIRHEIGSSMTLSAGPIRLQGKSPLSATWHLKRDGETVETLNGSESDFEAKQPGVYRVELWLEGLDGPQIWILSSPIYVK